MLTFFRLTLLYISAQLINIEFNVFYIVIYLALQIMNHLLQHSSLNSVDTSLYALLHK